jgi:hypothetical protein
MLPAPAAATEHHPATRAIFPMGFWAAGDMGDWRKQ